MTHTEKYELPLIEGTDVIDYEPFNEGMEKIEEVLENNENLVQEAVDDVAEMGDTLNQKVAEVNQALEDTQTEISEEVGTAISNLTDYVNQQITTMPKYTIARKYSVPSETYVFGGDYANLVFPLTALTPILKRGTNLSSNSFVVDGAQQDGTPVSKVTFDCNVEPADSLEDYSMNNYVDVSIIHHRTGTTDITEITQRVNTSSQAQIHLETLVTAARGDTFTIYFSSPLPHFVVGSAALTVENIGRDN